jgi:hypothetical protein
MRGGTTIAMKKRKSHLRQIGAKPGHEKLTWPGLKAKDHLSRVITWVVKEAKETRENEEWAGNQIARVLDYVSPQTVIGLVFRETDRRRSLTPGLRNLLSDFLKRWRA